MTTLSLCSEAAEKLASIDKKTVHQEEWNRSPSSPSSLSSLSTSPTSPSCIESSTNNDNNKCCVCLEQCQTLGIRCNSSSKPSHFICQNCFSPYVSSLCEETYKLIDSSGQITCPVPGCQATPWTSHEVRKVVVGQVLEKYIDILVNSLKRMKQKSENSPPGNSSDVLGGDININNSNSNSMSSSSNFLHSKMMRGTNASVIDSYERKLMNEKQAKARKKKIQSVDSGYDYLSHEELEDSTMSSSSISSILSQNIFSSYATLSPDKQDLQTRQDVLLISDALTLKCPERTCRVALDPNPDGCASMRCVGCGENFCWLCFQLQIDSASCHVHVRRCRENPSPGSLFISQDLMEGVLKKRKIEAVRRVLEVIAEDDTHESRALSLQFCAQDLLSNSTDIIGDNEISEREAGNAIEEVRDAGSKGLAKGPDGLCASVPGAASESSGKRRFGNHGGDDKLDEEMRKVVGEVVGGGGEVEEGEDGDEGGNVGVEAMEVWRENIRCRNAVLASEFILKQSHITFQQIFDSGETSVTSSHTQSLTWKEWILSLGPVDYLRTELRNQEYVCLCILEGLLGWRMVTNFFCSLVPSWSTWLGVIILYVITGSLAVYRPAEVCLAYFTLGFFNLIRFLVYLRSLILTFLVGGGASYGFLVTAALVGFWWLQNPGALQQYDNNTFIVAMHVAGFLLVDAALFFLFT